MSLTIEQNQAIKRALHLAGLRTAVSWDADGNAAPKARDVSQQDYDAAVAILRDAANRQPRVPRSLTEIVAAIDALTNPQKMALLNAARDAAEASANPVVRVMGALTWILTDATARTKAVAVLLREDPMFARRVAIAIDGDQPAGDQP